MLVHVGLDWNVTSTPWAKFEVAKPMDESRNQVVNPNASPGAAGMNPVGLGVMGRWRGIGGKGPGAVP